MSSLVFHDTITLFLPKDTESAPDKRIIRRVKSVLTQGAESGKTKATVYLPLWGRRSLRYLPDAWDGSADRFTVRPGDRLVCREEKGDLPPEDALTVQTVICRRCGSRRLWHLEIHADHTYEEVTSDEGIES